MGGSKKQTVGYRYFAGVHMALCHGPIDALLKVKVDEKELWAGSSAGGAITVDKKDMFGGESREGGISGTFDFMTGHGAQTQNDYLVSKLGSLVPAFRGVASVVLRQMYLSMNPYLKTWSFLASRIHLQQDGSPQWQDALAQIDVTVYNEDGDEETAAAMNPAHIIRECLTNRLWGMGYAEADIDDTSFIAAATTLKAELMGMALLWDTQTSIEEFVKIILQHIDASIYVDRRTGKFVLKLIRGDYDEDNLLILNPSNVDKIDDFKRATFGELCNSVTVNYYDYSKNATGSVTVQDIALAQEQGGDNNTTVTYEGFIDHATASKSAQRDLKTLSTPLISCTVYATKVGRNLNIGDVFKLEWPDYQIGGVVMRVTGIAFGNGKTRRVRIQCAQDVFSYPEDAFVSKPPSGWVNPVGQPGPPIIQMAFEMPYFELVRENGQASVDSAIATNPYIGYLGAACTTGLVATINATLLTDDGSGYAEVGVIDFCAGAFLTADIGKTETEITVVGGSAMSLVEENEWFQIGNELFGVVSIAGSVITVKRGVLDTIPEPHSAGSAILFWDGQATIDPTEYVSSDEVSAKITPANGSGVYPIASATALPVLFVGRAGRPFPPKNVKINGEYEPETIVGEVSLIFSWNTRNRIVETGGTLIGWFDALDVVSEDGATTTVRIKNSADIVVREVNGITTTSYEYTTADEISDFGLGTLSPSVRVELTTIRDGIESMLPYTFEINRDVSPPSVDYVAKVSAKYSSNTTIPNAETNIAMTSAVYDDAWGWTVGSANFVVPSGVSVVIVTVNFKTVSAVNCDPLLILYKNGAIVTRQYKDNQYWLPNTIRHVIAVAPGDTLRVAVNPTGATLNASADYCNITMVGY